MLQREAEASLPLPCRPRRPSPVLMRKSDAGARQRADDGLEAWLTAERTNSTTHSVILRADSALRRLLQEGCTNGFTDLGYSSDRALGTASSS